MSGRKSTEVAAVLKQGESIRALTDGVYSREIQRSYADYLENLSAERDVKKSAAGLEVALETDAREMFGAEAITLAGDFDGLKSDLSAQGVDDNGRALLSDLERLDSELKAADREAEDIRQSIRGKNWYCDDEYRRAQVLVEKYGQLRDSRVSLERRMKNLLAEEGRQLSTMREKAARLDNLADRLKNMNATAKKRKAADSYRAELRKNLADIDSTAAEKFFAADFSSLQKKIDAACNLSDDAVLTAFKENFAAVTDFQTKLAARIALLHKQKSDAEAAFAQMERAAAETLIGPVDYYNDVENGARVGLFEYLKTYAGQDLAAKYAQMRSDAAELLASENFTDAMKIAQTAAEFAENARQAALSLQESMLKKTELAGAIQDVMEDMRYDTDLEILNGNPNDGFRITCRVGDELIDFQRVDIDDNGKIVIPVTDVCTASGSVLHKAAATSTSTSERSTRHGS